MNFYFQGTTGKLLLKLNVVNLKGQRPDLGHAAIRNIGKVVSSLPLMYGFLRILAPHLSQTLHDELAKCFVIDVQARQQPKQLV